MIVALKFYTRFIIFLAATPETAFVHAISSAGITYEAILQCRRNNIPGCKCLKEKPLLPKSSGTVAGCGDNIEFGQKQTRRFFEKLEKGNDARMAVNLHNNEVGRQVPKLEISQSEVLSTVLIDLIP